MILRRKNFLKFCYSKMRRDILSLLDPCVRSFPKINRFLIGLRTAIFSYLVIDYLQPRNVVRFPFNVFRIPFMIFLKPFNVFLNPFMDFVKPFNAFGFPFKRKEKPFKRLC